MTRTTQPPAVNTLSDLIAAITGHTITRGAPPIAAVLSERSALSDAARHSLMGISVAFDPDLTTSQIIFFDDPQLFQRYAAQIP